MSDFRPVRVSSPDRTAALLELLLDEARRTNALLVEIKGLLEKPDPIPVVPHRGPS